MDRGPESQTILVVGGGIAGITAAVEAAEMGHDVILLEKSPSLGGRVARMHRFFPKLCPPHADWRSISSATRNALI